MKNELAEIVFKVEKVIERVTGRPCAGSLANHLESLISLEAMHTAPNLKELNISSAQ